MKFNVVNLGCKVNRVESDDFIAAFLQAGASLNDSGAADLVIINSCTVTSEAAKKTRKAVRNALQKYPQARVVVTGCAATIDPTVFADIDTRVIVWEKDRVFEEAESLSQRNDEKTPTRLLRIGETFPTRVNIKIQDGCDRACTFCIVHVARGKATSRPFGQVVEEISAYAKQGVNEVVLTGINLGSYNDEDFDLVDLLKILLAKTEVTRFRLSSIEPKDVTAGLIDLMASADGRICRHSHIPLQAGSDKILKDMARDYNVAFYRDLSTRLYKAMPTFSLTTDILVGFPGETEDDFEQTLALAKECRFSKIHVFPYSRRNGTPAAERTDQVPDSVKNERAKRLRQVAEELRKADLAMRKEISEMILVEQEGIAVTESYHHIEVPKGLEVGDLIARGQAF